MSTPAASAPSAMAAAAPALELLCDYTADLQRPYLDVGMTPAGHRMVSQVLGGKVTGPRLNGEILPSGGDWGLVQADGFMQLDVRGAMRTDDGAVLYVSYRGMFDPLGGYFRIQPVFETGAEAYRWLTRVLCVGVGRRTDTGVGFTVYVVR